MEYDAISKKTMGYIYQSYQSLKDSPLNSALRAIVELRTSQINGCAYCCRMHTEEAKKEGVSEEKLNDLPLWNTVKVFSEKERAALFGKRNC